MIRLLGLLAVGLLSVMAGPARAQGNPTPPHSPSPELAEAERLNQQVIQLYQQGNYATAVPLAQNVLAIRERILGNAHPDVAESLNNLALLYQDQGKYRAAEPLHQRALTIWEHALGPNHPLVATSLNNLALLHKAQGNYAAAEPLLKRSLAIREQVLGKAHPNVAQSLNNLALLYQDQGNYAAAEPLHQRSLALWEQAFGSNHPLVATSLSTLALLHMAQGNYTAAEPLLQRSLAIREQVLGKAHPDVGYSLNNLALLHQDQGNYAAAEPLYQRALTLWEQALGNHHPLVATSLNNLASLHKMQGNYSIAEPLYQRSLAIREQAFGKAHPDVAQSLNNWALLYQDQGNYAAAEPLLKRSLTILEQALGKAHPDVATSLNNLALLHHAQGNYTAAERLYQQSLAIREQALGPNHPGVATSLNNLAFLHQSQGNYTAAKPLYQRSQAILEQVLGPNHPDVATSLNNLALLQQQQSNYGAAASLYQRSLAIREQTLGNDHPQVATSLNNLASMHQHQGRYAVAHPLYQRSLAMRERSLGPNHPDVAASLKNLAWLRWAEGQVVSALDWQQRGLAVEERNLTQNLVAGSEVQKRAYAETFTASSHFAVSLHLQGAPTNLVAARSALTTILRRKGRVLDVLTDSFQRLRSDLSPENQTHLDRLASLRRHYATLAYTAESKLPLAQRQAQMAQLEQQADQLEAELSQRSVAFRTEAQPVEIADVQAQIPANAVLIEFYRYHPFHPQGSERRNQWGQARYGAYWLLPGGEPQWRDLGDAKTIDQAVVEFQRQLLNLLTDQDAKVAGRQLDALILEPIRQQIGHSRQLLIAPDSQLNLIPFAALVDAQNRYLIETYNISYLTSGRDLLRLQTLSPSQHAPVIFAQIDHSRPGNPNSVQLAQQGQVQVAQLAPNPPRKQSRRSPSFSLQFNNLEHTGAEATAIAPNLSNAVLFTNSNATENALKSLRSPQILHLATHGFFLENQPHSSDAKPARLTSQTDHPLLRSGLVFAGSNLRQSGEEDGILSALEASELKLKGTQLIVMSACQTGRGDVANGEGVYGLRRAMVLAGAESQIMTLWSIYDESTRYFMTEYYQMLKQGGDRASTLRQIQLNFLRQQNTESDYSHPAYWAAFTLTGNWQKLRP